VGEWSDRDHDHDHDRDRDHDNPREMNLYTSSGVEHESSFDRTHRFFLRTKLVFVEEETKPGVAQTLNYPKNDNLADNNPVEEVVEERGRKSVGRRVEEGTVAVGCSHTLGNQHIHCCNRPKDES